MMINQRALGMLEELTAKYPDVNQDFKRVAFEALNQYPGPCQTVEELQKLTACQLAGILDGLRVHLNMYEGDAHNVLLAAMSKADAQQ